MNNRGLLHLGYAADITIFNAEEIDRGEEYYVQDVPGDGSRYVRDSIGIDTVIIGGEVAYRGGEYTESTMGSIIPGVEGA
jgi:N-acyl-D-aspartate/D-glutamate deacylase